MSNFNSRVNEVLVKVFPKCPHCGGQILVKTERHTQELGRSPIPASNVPFPDKPIGVRLSEPREYWRVTGLYCEDCRTVFEPPEDIGALNLAEALGVGKVELA